MSSAKKEKIYITCDDNGKKVEVDVLDRGVMSITVVLPVGKYEGELTMVMYRKTREAKTYVGKKFGYDFSFKA